MGEARADALEAMLRKVMRLVEIEHWSPSSDIKRVWREAHALLAGEWPPTPVDDDGPMASLD